VCVRDMTTTTAPVKSGIVARIQDFGSICWPNYWPGNNDPISMLLVVYFKKRFLFIKKWAQHFFTIV